MIGKPIAAYLPIRSKRGKPDLVTYSGCSEGFLRMLIRTGQLRYFQSPKRILVRTSWFDEYVDRIQKREIQTPGEIVEFARDLLA